MKKLVKYIIIIAGLVTLASCKDFFETDSTSALSSETVYKSEILSEQAVLGIYDIIGEDKSYRNRLAGSYAGYNTDIEKSTKYGDYNVTWTNSDLGNRYNGADCWGWLFKGVERANLCINGMETYSDTTKAKFSYLLAEALTMRAFLYNDIIKWWGDVPYRFEPMTDANKYSPKVDRNIIYERLLSDLARAEKLLGANRWSESNPASANNSVERVNLAFVKGLRARIALMYAGYALRPDQLVQGGSSSYSVQLNTKNETKRKALYKIALDETADVIAKYGTNAGGKLEANYVDIFKKQCSDVVSFTKSESLFELPFSTNRGQILNLCGLKVDNGAGTTAQGYLLHCPGGHSVGGNVSVLPTFYYTFAQGDKRRDVTACVYKWTYCVPSAGNNGGPSQITDAVLWQKIQDASKLALGKWRFEWMARDPTSSGDDGVNFCVMRYADILLMYAEAAIGDKNGAAIPDDASSAIGGSMAGGVTPQAAFDAVRARAGLSTLPLTFDNIANERAFEFCGENIRKYDLMRWGLLKTNMDAVVPGLISIATPTTTITYNGVSYPIKIWVHYSAKSGYTQNGKQAYVIDSIVGIRPGETTTKPTLPTTGYWQQKGFAGANFSSTFTYYTYNRTNNDASMTSAANPDMWQLWPIFQSNISSSNGTLWNDYGYPN